MEKNEEKAAMEEMEYRIGQGSLEISTVMSIAEYYSEKDDFENAKVYFEEAIRIDPFQRKVHIEYAKALRKTALLGQALEELDIALRVAPELEPLNLDPMGFIRITPVNQNSSLAEIHAEKGEIYFDLDEIEKATVEVDRALYLSAEQPGALALKKKLESLGPVESLK
ncbi:MAG: hypothetical protein ABIK28_03010 [Planctomycetota bacterium]